MIEVPDQAGGRIFADQLNTNGPTGQQHGRTAALRVAGFEKTLVQFRALQGNGNGGGWIDAVGTGDASDDGPAIRVFTGAAGTADGQYDVKNGGRLIVRGVYHERSTAGLKGVHLADSGLLSIDATRFSYTTSENSPMFSTDGFRGMFTLATSILVPVAAKETCRFELRGDGSQTNGLVMNSQFWVRKPGTTAETIWVNKAQPAAHGGLVGSNMISDNKEVSARGFEFLDNVGDQPSLAKSAGGSEPLADHGGVDDATILRHLAPLRSTRPVDPTAAPAGQTDIRLYRIYAQGGRGATVEILAPSNESR